MPFKNAAPHLGVLEEGARSEGAVAVAVAPNLAHKISSYKLIDMTCVGAAVAHAIQII
jgi:hypothetical protein